MRIAHIEDEEVDSYLLNQAFSVAHIEDNAEYASLVDYVLPYDITRFYNVDDFEDDVFDIIITDLRLTKTYGLETIKELRSKTDLPIIVLTGMGGNYLRGRDYQAFMEAGANEVFDKEMVSDPTFALQVIEVLEEYNNEK